MSVHLASSLQKTQTMPSALRGGSSRTDRLLSDNLQCSEARPTAYKRFKRILNCINAGRESIDEGAKSSVLRTESGSSGIGGAISRCRRSGARRARVKISSKLELRCAHGVTVEDLIDKRLIVL